MKSLPMSVNKRSEVVIEYKERDREREGDRERETEREEEKARKR